MAQAYQCDRCETLLTGFGSNEFYVGGLAWEPAKHSYSGNVTMNICSFKTKRGVVLAEPDLCKGCRIIVFELALDKLRKS